MAHEQLTQNANSIQNLLDDLRACTPAQLQAWIKSHRASIDLQFFQKLKDIYANPTHVFADSQEAERLTRYAIDIAKMLQDEPLALAMAYWARGVQDIYTDSQTAVEYFRLALPTYEHIGDALSVIRLAMNLMVALMECGRFSEAEVEYLRASQSAAKNAEIDSYYLLILEQNYGILLLEQGRYSEALRVYERALTIANEHNQSDIALELRINRALTLGQLGHWSEMEQELLRSRAVALEQQQILSAARIDMDLGHIYESKGEWDHAIGHYEQSLQVFRQSSDILGMAEIYSNLGNTHQSKKEWDRAISYYVQSLQIAEQVGNIPGIAQTCYNLGRIYQSKGERDKAETYYKYALDIRQAETETNQASSIGLTYGTDAAAREEPGMAVDTIDRFELDQSSDEISEVFAVARIKEHEPNQPFYIGNLYVLHAGVQTKKLEGFAEAAFSLPSTEPSIPLEIVVHAEDIEIQPNWIQSFVFSRYELSPLISFFLKPTTLGRKQIRVEFLYQRHWLTQIRFEIEVVEAQVPALP